LFRINNKLIRLTVPGDICVTKVKAKTEGDKNYLQRKCERLDKQIDQLVYQLYGLTEEEIRIVEENIS